MCAGGGGDVVGVVNEYPVVDLQWQKNFPNPSAAGAASGPAAEFT